MLLHNLRRFFWFLPAIADEEKMLPSLEGVQGYVQGSNPHLPHTQLSLHHFNFHSYLSHNLNGWEDLLLGPHAL